MPPASRVSDMHVCPMVTPGTPPVPHVGGPILPPCSPTVITSGMPQSKITDMAVCVGPPDTIIEGAVTVLTNNLPSTRIGSMTSHGGKVVIGAPTVMVP